MIGKKKIIIWILMWINFFCLNLNVLAEENLEKKDINALGAVLIDFKTGRVLWEKNAHEKLAMASTTKIMTGILALEKKDLDLEKEILVSKSVLSVPKVKLNLTPGEKIKLKYLLFALMLESANDAAVVIAEEISGSVDKFCNLMTEKAKEIGAFDTSFKTPNGLDRDGHFSTAYDMAMIARYAMKNDKFMELINTPSVSFSSDKKNYVINNKNRLLKEFDGANGIKTGFTGKAGHCFVGAAKKNDMQLISVVLGSGWGAKGKEAKWSDTKKILNYVFENYFYKKIICKDCLAKKIKINRAREKNLSLIYEKDVIVPMKQTEEKNLCIKIVTPKILVAPIEKNKIYGCARVFIGSECVAKINLLANKNIKRHDLKSVMQKIFYEWINFDMDLDLNFLK